MVSEKEILDILITPLIDVYGKPSGNLNSTVKTWHSAFGSRNPDDIRQALDSFIYSYEYKSFPVPAKFVPCLPEKQTDRISDKIPEKYAEDYFAWEAWYKKFKRGYGVKAGSHPEYLPVEKLSAYIKLTGEWLASNKWRVPKSNLGFEVYSQCLGVMMWQDNYILPNIDRFLAKLNTGEKQNSYFDKYIN